MNFWDNEMSGGFMHPIDTLTGWDSNSLGGLIDINPATNLPMISEYGGVDVGGNPYGVNNSFDDGWSGGSGSHFGDSWGGGTDW